MIQAQAMLANLNIKSWTGRKHDKSISEEVDATHNAKDGGRYNKMLVDKAALEPLAKLTGQVRAYHYAMTLPWGDNGDRLLPAKSYMEYAAAMRVYRQDNERLVRTFVAQYPTIVADARTRLGSMYNAADYPDAAYIAERFAINVSFMPVPDVQDFRVDVSEEALEEIKSSLNAALIERQAGAIKECWTRLHTVVHALHVVMLKEKPIFRDSLIENITDLIAMIPKLNITNDKDLNEICQTIGRRLIKPLALLRKSATARHELSNASAEVLSLIAPKI